MYVSVHTHTPLTNLPLKMDNKNMYIFLWVTYKEQ